MSCLLTKRKDNLRNILKRKISLSFEQETQVQLHHLLIPKTLHPAHMQKEYIINLAKEPRFLFFINNNYISPQWSVKKLCKLNLLQLRNSNFIYFEGYISYDQTETSVF